MDLCETDDDVVFEVDALAGFAEAEAGVELGQHLFAADGAFDDGFYELTAVLFEVAEEEEEF